MLSNRSVPTNVLLPHLTYQNVGEAVEWLTTTFGFSEHFRYGSENGDAQGAQLHYGDAWIMLSTVRPGRDTPAQLGASTQSITIFVDDVDAHYARTRAAGAEIHEELNVAIYGE